MRTLATASSTCCRSTSYAPQQCPCLATPPTIYRTWGILTGRLNDLGQLRFRGRAEQSIFGGMRMRSLFRSDAIVPSVTLHSRRRFLLFTAGSSLALAGRTLLGEAAGAQQEEGYWHDPASWPNGQIPGPSDIAVIDRPIVFAGEAHVAGVQIRPGASLRFWPSSFYGANSSVLKSTGNVIVEGNLIMRPTSSSTRHTLRFTDVDEAAFVGGGLDPLPSDVGLWVIGAGVLDVQGTPLNAWTRPDLRGDISAGATSLILRDVTGWGVGDRIVIVPTQRPSTNRFDDSWWDGTGFEERTITGVSGTTVALDTPLGRAHPRMMNLGAEVANLTRNVVIEGTPEGRSHVFIRSTSAQVLDYAHVRHMGPRKNGLKVLGRWPLHWHHQGDASRGQVHTGLLVTQAGSHAYVPHKSHGITLDRCVAYDCSEDAFWWDETQVEATNDITWNNCLAARLRTAAEDDRGVAGFYLPAGSGNSIRGCVGVGTQGEGISHPARISTGEWTMDALLGHNNRGSGMKVYLNTNQSDEKLVSGLLTYHNAYGIHHGAYGTDWIYQGGKHMANAKGGVALAAVSQERGLHFEDITFDAGGFPDAVTTDRHFKEAAVPTTFTRCTLTGATRACLAILPNQLHDLIDLNDCTLEGNALWLDDAAVSTSLVRIRGGNVGNWDVRPKGQPGTFFAPWNAARTPA